MWAGDDIDLNTYKKRHLHHFLIFSFCMNKDRLPTFYPIIGTAAASTRGVAPEEVARALARAGVGITQFRHKGPYTRKIFETAALVGRTLREAGALFIVNDRPDIALLVGADGVHVGQDDLPPAEVRSFLENSSAGNSSSRETPMLIGFSTHNEHQLREAELAPVDYLAIGPIFATASKEKPDPVVGLEELRRLRPLTDKPLVAIGGISRENADQVLAAGADSLAVVSDFLGPDVDARLREWTRIAKGGGDAV